MTARKPYRDDVLSLGGLFFLLTYVALCLVLDTQLQYPVFHFAMFLPVPPVAYLLAVRYWMKRKNVDYERRSVLANVMFVIGFLITIATSVATVGTFIFGWSLISEAFR